MKEFVEKLIEKFEKEAFAVQLNQGIKHPSTHDMFLETFTVRQIEEIVNQLAEEYNNGWIPCSERLPEKYGEYLCCDTYGNFVLGFPSESDTSDTGFIVETEHEYCYDIIAWMPLPEPYQKGE